MKKVAIIGCGASGLICGIVCAKNGIKVDIFEQNSKCAKKILASGNGHCNIHNTNVTKDDYHSSDSTFVEYALKLFGYKEFKKFVYEMGLLLKESPDGRVYPLSYESKSVANVLIDQAKSLGVNIYTDTKIDSAKELFKEYKIVVIASGLGAFGGSDDALSFAKEFSHSIIAPYPSLVQLHLDSKSPKKMSGVKIDASLKLFIDKKLVQKVDGDLLFSDYGISGFATLDISQKASLALLNKQKVEININLLKDYQSQELALYIHKISNNLPNRDLLDILSYILPIKIAKALLEELKLPFDLTCIDTKTAKLIASKINSWQFRVVDTRGFKYAELSGGGVDVREIDPKTYESKKCKNLYICGEALDVVGRRGGFNLAFAFASGFVVARSISLKETLKPKHD